MERPDSGDDLLDSLGLNEYEATALEQLLGLGRTTAPNLADATGIPKARIYGVLESLGDAGFIEIIPGRPKEYQPKPPETILQRAEENRRQSFEDYRRELESLQEPFLEYFQPRYEQASESVSPTEELFHVVSVGEPSIRETRSIYREAETKLHIMTKSFEYLEEVTPALRSVLDAGIDVKVLLLHPSHLSEVNEEIQRQIRGRLDTEFDGVDYRFSNEPMPWRGTLADPSMEYETGTAILLVEEKDVPLHMRQAAITDNESFVAGLNRYFSLIWEYDSVATP